MMIPSGTRDALEYLVVDPPDERKNGDIVRSYGCYVGQLQISCSQL